MLAKRFYWILTDSVALTGNHRADIPGRAGLRAPQFGPVFYSFLLCSPDYTT